jgi:hypothetical protein
MRSVDTNALVRLVTGADERQFAAAARYVTGGAWVSYLALGETTWSSGPSTRDRRGRSRWPLNGS